MKKYIIPQIIKYETIDGLLESNNSNSKENLSIDKLLHESLVCIVGEPGIGKSRLIDEIRSRNKTDLYFCAASDFKLTSITKDIKYCIIDALDEVEGSIFYRTLQSIKQYKKDNPNVKVLFTCRIHYVASYAKHLATFNNISFIKLCRLRNEDVMEIVNVCSEITKINVSKSSKLRELLRIPGYLTMFLEFEEQKGECSNIGQLFNCFVSKSIATAINNRGERTNTENLKILIQRVLEKVAFIMEISQKTKYQKMSYTRFLMR